MWVPRRHAPMATTPIIRTHARRMVITVRNGLWEACSLARVPGTTAGTAPTVITDMVLTATTVVADGMVAATTGRAPMHIAAELDTRVVGLRAEGRAVASMVVVDVAKRPR